MAARLKNILRFVAVAPGAPATLAHGLNWDTLAVVPDIAMPSVQAFAITADATNVTVVNNGPAAANIDVLVESWHTLERDFGAVQTVVLAPQPFVPDFTAVTGGYPPSRVIQVDPLGLVPTITAGLAAAAALIPPPAAAAPVLVFVAPATYIEAPLTVPTGVILATMSALQRQAIIVASVAISPLVTLSPGSEIEGFALTGANGVGGIGLLAGTAGVSAIARNIAVTDCTTNFHVTGGATLSALALSASRAAVADAGTTGYLVDSGSVFECSTLQVLGSAGAPFVDGLLVTGVGSRASVSVARSDDNTDGFHADDGGLLELATGLSARCTNALHIGAAGTGGTMRTFSVSITAATLCILIDGANGTWFDNGSLIDESLMTIADGASVTISVLSETPLTGEQSQLIIAELHVGTDQFPQESAFGEGDSHVRGLSVLKSVSLDVGAFTDITAILESPAGSSVTAFTTGAINNTLFIGGDRTFQGIKLDTTTAIALGAGALVLEVSDGAGGWIAIDVCVCDSVLPYLSHGQTIFGRVAFEQIRFEDLSGVAWVAQAINAITKFWLRIRVITAGLGTNPVIESLKLGTNRTEINADGILEFFGTAEPVKEIIMHQRLLDDLTGSGSPGNAALVFSANITTTPIDNSFTNNNLDGLAAIVTVPEGLDTSRPVVLDVHWIPAVNGAGDVEWETNLVEVPLGASIDGSLPEVSNALIHVIGAGSIDVLQQSLLPFRITELAPGDQFVFSLFRDARAGNPQDTLAGNVEVVSIEMHGTFWR